jgi:hypothetical protein
LDKKQRTFLIIITALVASLALILGILKTAREQAAPTYTVTQEGQKSLVPDTGLAAPERTKAAPEVKADSQPTQPAGETGQVFYVSPQGSQKNDGSQTKPWPLQYALDQPKQIEPGATIWLVEGVYTGPFTSQLKGEKGSPIIVRAVPGQRAILESDTLVLDISTSQYVSFWGLEIRPTHNTRDPKQRDQLRGSYGVRINQSKESHDIKFINMIVHDMPAQGFGWWQSNRDSEIYGSLIFYNGVTQFDHGIYVHNAEGEKRIFDNMIFDNASHGIHAYGEKDYQKLDNIHIEGNTLFDNGSIGFVTTLGSYGEFKRNILVGGSLLEARHPVITNNYTYYPGNTGEALNLGYKAGSTDAMVENNYFAGGQVKLGGSNAGITMQQNTILGTGLAGIFSLTSKNNTLLRIKPLDSRIFVRPNQYEPGRANITIYNWGSRPVITLTRNDLAGIALKKGDQYELHNVQDYFEDVVTGTFDGKSIEVPMNNHTVAQPMGLDFKPPSTFPEFGAFILMVNPAR